MTDEDFHAKMAAEYEKQKLKEARATADEKRRANHFQVRLPVNLARQLRHYCANRSLNVNQALTIIVSKFFN